MEEHKEIKIGSRVKLLADPSVRGEVVGFTKSKALVVELEDGTLEQGDQYSFVVINDELEQEFKKIVEKINQATDLLAEANRLANFHNTTLQELYIDGEFDVYPFFKQLDLGGWQTSSMQC
jgi:hypothetical protein